MTSWIGSRATVLVADDDRSLLEVLRRTLADLGPQVRVLPASTGEEALSVLRRERVDVLVTDHKMPGMSGLDLVAEGRRTQPDLQAILLTAHANPEELLAAINEGHVYRYLVKPYQRAELLAAVRQSIDNAFLRRERDALLRRQQRRLHTMSALVELSARASAPASQRQLLEHVRQALVRIVPFDVAALLIVPPLSAALPAGTAVLPGSALMLLTTGAAAREGHVVTGSSSDPAALVDARDRCLATYNAARAGHDAPSGPQLDAGALIVQVVGPGLVPGPPGGPDSELRRALVTTNHDGRPCGAIYVAHAEPDAYSDDDAQNLEALATLTAELSGRIAARVEDERRRMELMVSSMADGVIMTDHAGEIFLLNPAARRMLGLPPPEAAAPITSKFLKEKLGFYPFELVRAGRAEDGPVREEVRVGDQTLHSIVSQVVDGGGQMVGVVVVLRDVTEEKELSSRKEEFVSIVSHELRTPLTSISGALELLVEQYDEGLSEKQLRYVHMARDSAQKLNGIVDDLLDVARAERGKLELRTGDIDLGALLRDCVERFRGAGEQKRIRMTVKTEGMVHLTADADRLTQVLSNLLSNAIKFTPDGGEVVAEAFTSTATDELVALTIWNSGPTISEQDRERVFDKFEQVQQSATRRVGGTGLGLAISRGIIERHGGQIWVEPTRATEGGARFVVTLPVRAHELPEGAVDHEVVPGLQKSILLVDDDQKAALLLKGALLGARHKVFVAEDSESALVFARERRPDLVSVDLQMPAPSGAELVEILRHDPDTRKIPVMVISATRGAPVSDTQLQKPVKLSTLRETVLTLLSEAGNLRRRVLVVDDDAGIRLISREVLEAHGFLVREAEDGKAALAESRRFRPDLILVDVMMPELDGFEVAQRLRAERETAAVPIIFVSARGQTADKVKAFKLGAEDYLVKPFDSVELVARVEKALLRRDSDLGASPTTRLPGSQVIEREIERRLRERGHFAFCYLDLDNLKAFNDYYGYAKADAVIQQTGDVVREAVARFGNPVDFIGHIAGDDFVLITTVDRVDAVCGGVIEAFDRLVPLYYNKSDREKGYIEARDRFGQLRKFPIMSVSIACVTGGGGLRSTTELSTAAAELKQQAKAVVGSSYVRDGQVLLPARAAG